MENQRRIAIVNERSNSTWQQIKNYLPYNYGAMEIEAEGGATIVIVGYDKAGWTMDEYVLPRLASGLHFAAEVTADELADRIARLIVPIANITV